MRLATVKIKNRTTKQIVKINEIDWALSPGMGRFAGWERIGERNDGSGEQHKVSTPEDTNEVFVPKDDPISSAEISAVKQLEVTSGNEKESDEKTSQKSDEKEAEVPAVGQPQKRRPGRPRKRRFAPPKAED